MSILAEIEVSENTSQISNDGVGIDIGIKTLVVCSDAQENINRTKTVRQLKKKQRRLQRGISRKYCKNKKGVVTGKHAIL